MIISKSFFSLFLCASLAMANMSMAGGRFKDTLATADTIADYSGVFGLAALSVGLWLRNELFETTRNNKSSENHHTNSTGKKENIGDLSVACGSLGLGVWFAAKFSQSVAKIIVKTSLWRFFQKKIRA